MEEVNSKILLCFNKEYSIADYNKDFRQGNKKRIARFIFDRFEERYIKPFKKNKKKNGFSMMAVACLMIEALESFYQGFEDTKNKSKNCFKTFFEHCDELKSKALELDDRKLIWFINNVRENLYYTLNHSWYNPDSDKIGLTPFYGDIEGIYSVNVENLKYRLFKLYYCEEYDEYLGTSIDDVLKTYSKMYTWSHFVHPVTGKVIDVNTKLKTNPFKIFRDPFGEGWICRIKPNNLERDLKNLYTPFEYILINYDRYFRKIYAKVSKKKYRW